MKHKIELQKWMPVAFLLLVPLADGQAQGIKRQSIGGIGNTMTTAGVTIQHTAGQPFSTVTTDGEISFLPGFQQPANARLAVTNDAVHVSVNVYPNPASDIVSIETKDKISHAYIQIASQEGRIIFQEYISDLKTYLIDCSNWPTGMYLINIYNDQNLQFSSTLLINK